MLPVNFAAGFFCSSSQPDQQRDCFFVFKFELTFYLLVPDRFLLFQWGEGRKLSNSLSYPADSPAYCDLDLGFGSYYMIIIGVYDLQLLSFKQCLYHNSDENAESMLIKLQMTERWKDRNFRMTGLNNL